MAEPNAPDLSALDAAQASAESANTAALVAERSAHAAWLGLLSALELADPIARDAHAPPAAPAPSGATTGLLGPAADTWRAAKAAAAATKSALAAAREAFKDARKSKT